MNGSIDGRVCMKNNKGMTLIELIMVISILSIILLIPRLNGNVVLNYKERKELNELKKDLNYARNKAIVESCKYTVMLVSEKNYYVVYKHKAFREKVKRVEFTNGIKIKTTNFYDNEVVFNYSGVPKTGGTIYLENRKGQNVELRVTPATGKVNIYFN